MYYYMSKNNHPTHYGVVPSYPPNLLTAPPKPLTKWLETSSAQDDYLYNMQQERTHYIANSKVSAL